MRTKNITATNKEDFKEQCKKEINQEIREINLDIKIPPRFYNLKDFGDIAESVTCNLITDNTKIDWEVSQYSGDTIELAFSYI